MTATTANTVTIVGAGTIGVGWAIVFARAGCDVRLYDPEPSRLHDAPTEIHDRLCDLDRHGLLRERPHVVSDRVTPHAALDQAVDGACYIQECGPEQLETKQRLFAELDRMAAPSATIASSSSAFTASRIAAALSGRGRCLVVHPTNPPYLLPIVEVVAAPFTTPVVVDETEAFLDALGMSVIRVRREVEGFVVNRLQGALLREAYALVRDGVATADEIDRAVRDGPGRRWAIIGPFEAADLNTRGGIEAHASRMGPAYLRMGRERGDTATWPDALVNTVSRERRSLLPLDRWAARTVWRDRALMRFEQTRRQLEPFEEESA